jgi:hypothetical protein
MSRRLWMSCVLVGLFLFVAYISLAQARAPRLPLSTSLASLAQRVKPSRHLSPPRSRVTR